MLAALISGKVADSETNEGLSGVKQQPSSHGSSRGKRLDPARTDRVANKAQYRAIISCFAKDRGRGAIIILDVSVYQAGMSYARAELLNAE